MTRPDFRSPAAAAALRRAGGVALALTATFTVAACGGSDSSSDTGTAASTPTRLIDNKKVSDAIVASIREQRSIKATASCPTGVVQKEGATFECTARYRVKGKKDRVKATFVVTQKAGGNVTYVAK